MEVIIDADRYLQWNDETEKSGVIVEIIFKKQLSLTFDCLCNNLNYCLETRVQYQ